MNKPQIWHERLKLQGKKSANKYIVQKLIFFIICHKKENIRLRFWSFLAKHVLKIGLPWQQLGDLMTKRYIKGCVIG